MDHGVLKIYNWLVMNELRTISITLDGLSGGSRAGRDEVAGDPYKVMTKKDGNKLMENLTN